MYQMYLYSEFLVQVFCQVLCRVDGAVLPAGAAEAYGKVGEPAFHIPLYRHLPGRRRVPGKRLSHRLLQEADNGFVSPVKGL